jgi:small subunit ribosomal protein S18
MPGTTSDPKTPERRPFSASSSRPRSDDGGYGGYGGYEGPFGDDEGGDGRRRLSQVPERSRCRFCRDKATRVDYKDVLVLQKLCTSQGRIFSRKRSGNCATHQRLVKKAIKQARYIGLVPFTA